MTTEFSHSLALELTAVRRCVLDAFDLILIMDLLSPRFTLP
jgi:hypothetical protein